MIPFSQNRTPYPSETEHMATHLTASQLNYASVGASEEVILITPHPACPRGHDIQSEPLYDLKKRPLKKSPQIECSETIVQINFLLQQEMYYISAFI